MPPSNNGEARIRRGDPAARQAAGPQPSDMLYPGTTASDYAWDPSTESWAFNPHARPGQTYTTNAQTTQSGASGWVPDSDIKDPNGLTNGWTPAQLKSLALFAAGAAVPIPAFGGGGGAAGGAGAAAGSAIPDIATTSGLAGSGFGGAATIGASGLPAIPTTAGFAGSGFGGAAGSGGFVGALKGLATPTNLKTGANAFTDAGTILGGQQAGANNARISQGNLNQGQDRNAVSLYQAEQQAQNQAAQLDLQRQQDVIANRGTNAKQALSGYLLSGGYQPTHIGPTGSTGGIMASLAANPGALNAMRTFAQQANTAQNTPPTMAGGQLIAPPKLSQTPTIDTGNSALGLTGTGLQLAGAAAPTFLKILQALHTSGGG